jgi:hypothetical protein
MAFGRRGAFSTKGDAVADTGTEARDMTGNMDEWVVWNGSMGMLDMVAIGRVEHGEAGRSAWLAPPYDVVGPFSLDKLETLGRIAFGACHVLSRAKWREVQDELRARAREQRRAFAASFVSRQDDGEYREALELPPGGALTAHDIGAAFRRLAKKAHPDAGGDSDAYIRLTEARDTLLETVG